MDFFKFNPTDEETYLERGELINGITRSMWVERYSEPGEFSFEALLSTGIRDVLPLGTMISHINTSEVMIVENHEITETIQEDPSVIITGRSFVSFLENRIVGVNLARSDPLIAPYSLISNYTWAQIVIMIQDHIYISDVVDINDSLPEIDVVETISTSGTFEERIIDRGTVWERVSELLKIDDCGIKTVRRGPEYGNTTIVVYKGQDKSSSVMFSWKSGEIDSADYLFSQKNYKNSALVVGQYAYAMADVIGDNYNRRMMIIDATDIDGNFGSVPAGIFLDDIVLQLEQRGFQTLAKQKLVDISRADISKTARHQYRRDYNMGDLVTLDGNFNSSSVMRVVEYAEIEDENGESGHPTLAVPGPEGD
jgi:hypothetical protein